MDEHPCPVCGEPTAVNEWEQRGFWIAVRFRCDACGERGEDFIPVKAALSPVASALAVTSAPPVPAAVDMAKPVIFQSPKQKPAKRRAPPITPEKPVKKPRRQRRGKADKYRAACLEYETACKAHLALRVATHGSKDNGLLAAARARVAQAYVAREKLRPVEKTA